MGLRPLNQTKAGMSYAVCFGFASRCSCSRSRVCVVHEGYFSLVGVQYTDDSLWNSLQALNQDLGQWLELTATQSARYVHDTEASAGLIGSAFVLKTVAVSLNLSQLRTIYAVTRSYSLGPLNQTKDSDYGKMNKKESANVSIQLITNASGKPMFSQNASTANQRLFFEAQNMPFFVRACLK